MANKPDKFGLKFWMAVDVETKYLFIGVPYLEKDESRLDDVSMPTSVVMNLIILLFGRSYNVTCDNYFTSFDLLLRLAHERCSIVGTIHRNRRKVSEVLKTTRLLHETVVLKSTRLIAVTITTYQCKRFKPVSILSTLHPYVTIPEKDNPKKKADTILFYNSTKHGVDALDQISRCYSVKTACRQWPKHVFYNVLDLALINSWILYKKR